MRLDDSPSSLALWIVDAAHGRVSLPPGDVSPWDAFYADYRSAPPDVRARVDTVFKGLAASPHLAIRAAVVAHWFNAERERAFEALAAILRDHAELYAGQAVPDEPHSLRARLLDGLAQSAHGADALPAILASPPDTGPLRAVVGTYVGALGVDATDALVHQRPESAMAECIKAAGYELHRSPEVWSVALSRSTTWPAPLRAAMIAGGAAHDAVVNAAQSPGKA